MSDWQLAFWIMTVGYLGTQAVVAAQRREIRRYRKIVEGSMETMNTMIDALVEAGVTVRRLENEVRRNGHHWTTTS